MSFIAKNPLTLPEVVTSPSVPTHGTRGLFAGGDGWCDVDSNGNVVKMATMNDIEEIKAMIKSIQIKASARTVTISLFSSEWITETDNRHSQIVSIADITQYSKVDLQPTVEQLAIFREKDITFVTENEDGIITVFCLGQKPINDYSMQATITEVI